jgi:hypothetical protein
MCADLGKRKGVEMNRWMTGSAVAWGAVARGAVAWGAVALAGAVCCAGCGDPPRGSAANQRLCERLRTVGQDVGRLRSLDSAAAGPADIRVLVDQTRADLGRAAGAASGAAAARITLVSGAYNALSGALRALPPSVTARQAYREVKPQVLALDAAFNLAGVGVDCRA